MLAVVGWQTSSAAVAPDTNLPAIQRPADDGTDNESPDQLAGTHKTLEGGDLTISGSDPDFIVGTQKATIVCGNVPTANATVYIVNTVLMPPTM